MFLVAILDFTGRVILAILCLLWAIGTEIARLLVKLPQDIARAVRNRKAAREFSNDVDRLAAWYLEHMATGDVLPEPWPDEQVTSLVSEADLLIHQGGHDVNEVAWYLAEKHDLTYKMVYQALMTAEAHLLFAQQEQGNDARG